MVALLAISCYPPCISPFELAALERSVGDFSGVDAAWTPDLLKKDLDVPGVRALECSEYPCFVIAEHGHMNQVLRTLRAKRPGAPQTVNVHGVGLCADVLIPLHDGSLSDAQAASLARRMNAVKDLTK